MTTTTMTVGTAKTELTRTALGNRLARTGLNWTRGEIWLMALILGLIIGACT
jgi:hypothetical protein